MISLSSPLTETVVPANVGVPVCVAPWISLDVAGFAVGAADFTVGV